MGTFNMKLARQKKNFSEAEALEAILKLNPALKEADLTPEHTPAMWHWSQTDGSATPPIAKEEKKEFFTVEKNADYSKPDAIKLAAAELNTIEANIGIHAEDKTNIVFKKHKG